MRLRSAVASIVVLAVGHPIAALGQTANRGLFNGDLLEAFEYRDIGVFRMGARIADVDIPAAPAKDHLYTMYVAPWTGGLFKTTNNGTTWESIFDDQSRRLTVGDVALAPSDPDIVWVGTGDGFASRSSYAGDGVYESTDAGKTWEHKGLVDTHHTQRIVIHPTNPDIVYVAALGHLYSFNEDRGVYKTTNGGDSWEKVLYINEKVGVVDLVMDPQDPEVLYAAAWDKVRLPWQLVSGGPESGIYKTIDGGRSWTRLTGGLPEGRIGRIGLDIYRRDGNILYAIVDNANPSPNQEPDRGGRGGRIRTIGGEVYRSDDAGASWLKMNHDTLNVSSKGPYYFNQIRIDPNDERTIFLTGSPGGLSRDGGRTWERIFRGFFGDNRTFWFDPENSDRMIMGSDGGIAVSYDGGKTSTHLPSLPLGEIYMVGVDMEDPYNIYAGLQDHEHWKVPSFNAHRRGIAARDFLAVGDGDGMYTQVDPTDSRWLYTTRHYGGHTRVDQLLGYEKDIRPPDPPDGDPYRWLWATPIHISPHDPEVLYTGGQKLLRSADRGDTWTEISPDLSTNPRDKILPQSEGGVPGGIPWFTISSISESPITPGVIWVGLSDGKVHVTRDNGATWEDMTDELTALGALEEGYVSRVRASAHVPGRAYIAKSGYKYDVFAPFLYTTDDFGRTWRSISTGLPDAPINVVYEDLRNPNLLFVGNDVGVFVSIDRGETWVNFNNNMPNVPVHDLLVHPRDNDLILGTYGRGIWITNVSALQQLDDTVLAQDVHLFDVEPTVQRVTWEFGANDYLFGQAQVQTPNPESGMVVRYYLKNAVDDSVDIVITNSSGEEMARLKGPGAPGINSLLWTTRSDRRRGVGGFQGPADGNVIDRLAPLGEYTITLEAGGQELTTTGSITKTQGWSIGLTPQVIRSAGAERADVP